MEFSQKPNLQLYIGRYVQAILRAEDGEPWQWAIRLDSGVEIRNKDRKETFVPADLVGAKITTIVMSLQDTTIHFNNGNKWSVNPTQYAIYDPRHGGEVYPQWPEELEEAGIPSHPDEEVSAQPEDPEAWERARQQDLRGHDARIKSNAREFLEDK